MEAVTWVAENEESPTGALIVKRKHGEHERHDTVEEIWYELLVDASDAAALTAITGAACTTVNDGPRGLAILRRHRPYEAGLPVLEGAVNIVGAVNATTLPADSKVGIAAAAYAYSYRFHGETSRIDEAIAYASERLSVPVDAVESSASRLAAVFRPATIEQLTVPTSMLIDETPFSVLPVASNSAGA